MNRSKTRFLGVAVLCLAAGFGGDGALARGFTVMDFGAVPDDATCMARGAEMFRRMNSGDVQSSSWTVHAYGIDGELIDGAVVCAYGPNSQTQVSLVLHSWGDVDDEENRRLAIAERCRTIWEEQ